MLNYRALTQNIYRSSTGRSNPLCWGHREMCHSETGIDERLYSFIKWKKVPWGEEEFAPSSQARSQAAKLLNLC